MVMPAKMLRSGTIVMSPARPNPAPSVAASLHPLRITRFATSSMALSSTEYIPRKLATGKPYPARNCNRKLTGSTLTVS